MNDWTEDNGKTYCKKEKEKARVKFCNGWSFNMSENDITKFKKLKYITEEATYIIDVQGALTKGFSRPTKQGENKLYIPIKNFDIIPHENRKKETQLLQKESLDTVQQVHPSEGFQERLF